MDPLSILSLVEACAGLAVTAGKLAIGLKSLADNYKHSALTFRSLSSQCKLFATAVRAIQAWMEDAPDVTSIDDRIWEQLAHSLECANDTIYALENELTSTSGGTVNTFWGKANILWNLQTMQDLEDCIHKQICSLSVILQIMNLPTRKSQRRDLHKQHSVFQESRTSALSVRDTDTYTLKGGVDATSTVKAPSTIMSSLSQLPQFDFDEMLLTSQVYLRNRNKTLAMAESRSAKRGIRDAATSVNTWDLPFANGKAPYEVADPVAFVRRFRDSEDAHEVKRYVEIYLLPEYTELTKRYAKLKRYYFEIEDRYKQRENEMALLKTQNTKFQSLFDAAVELAQDERERTMQKVTFRLHDIRGNCKAAFGAAWDDERKVWESVYRCWYLEDGDSTRFDIPSHRKSDQAIQNIETQLEVCRIQQTHQENSSFFPLTDRYPNAVEVPVLQSCDGITLSHSEP